MIGTPRDLRHHGVVRSPSTRIGLRWPRLLAVVCGLALIATAAGCSRVNPQAAPSPSDTVSESPAASASPVVTPSESATLGSLTGAWKGTWTNTSPQTAVGTFVLTWAQQGTQLFGAIGVTGSNCISAGNVTGNIDGSKISFGAVEGGTSIQYDGILSGTIMTGTYHSDCGNSKGTWTAVKA